MRHGDKGNSAFLGENQLSGLDFRDSIQKEQSSTSVEAASEFGFANQDIKRLKRRLERN
ncbi:hypothetical protein R4Z10_16370 [Niallia sp. XMNu-256]|uniref:hypothetical protein n=1 Tax=Niallia sp. XMNu-256 TaxID=3082444 RepID=UPI0030CF7BE2